MAPPTASLRVNTLWAEWKTAHDRPRPHRRAGRPVEGHVLVAERDKPLSFHWRAADPSWIDDLDLPDARSRKRDAARSAILVDAALTGIAEPDRWISYPRANGWWSTGQRYRGSAFTRSTVPPSNGERRNGAATLANVNKPRPRLRVIPRGNLRGLPRHQYAPK